MNEGVMGMYHGSPDSDLKEIKNSNGAGDLFCGIFATDFAGAASHGEYLYKINSPKPLNDFELNYELSDAWDIALKMCDGDEEIAESVMSPGCEIPESRVESLDTEELEDLGWSIQRMRGILARKLGYTSVEMKDEHGTSWLCLAGCEVVKLAG